MNSINEQLKKLISEDRIYTSKLVAHLDWKMKFNHLLVVTSIVEKRYILLKDVDEIDLNSVSRKLYFTEVVKDSKSAARIKGVSNFIEEKDWLGNYAFILTTEKFNSRSERELIEKNYDKLIYLETKEVESVDFLHMDICIGYDNENSKWGFGWVRHDNPVYMEKGFLCLRKNSVTEKMGIIWCTKEEADFIFYKITLITGKFKRQGASFKLYPTHQAFLDDFLSIMRNIINKTMNISEINQWSSTVLSQYQVNKI